MCVSLRVISWTRGAALWCWLVRLMRKQIYAVYSKQAPGANYFLPENIPVIAEINRLNAIAPAPKKSPQIIPMPAA